MNYSFKRALFAASAFLLMTTPVIAAENTPQPTEQAKVPSASGAAAMQAITQAIDEKRMDDARNQTQALLQVCTPGSMDYALANLLMAQINSSTEKFAEAVPYLENALALKLFEAAEQERYTLGLAHLYVETKQKDKAVKLLSELIASVGDKVTPDMLYMYSVLLMETGNGAEAVKQSERLMRTSLNPPKEYYQLAASCAQNVGNYEKACAYLERLLETDPKNEVFWNQLVAMHFNAGELLSAIVSMERAQEKGLLTKEVNYITKVELYYNMERFPEAAKDIEEGLAKKRIPNEQRFWEMLCVCYDQMGEPDKADKVLEKASATTKWSGIDIRLAERNYRNGKFDKALANLESAVRKGGIDRPADIWVLMASAALETKNLEKAEKAMQEAKKYPEAAEKVEKLENALNILKKHIEEVNKKADKATN
jgi:tetratricopeptide (TPR) repeat protein